VSSGTVEGPVLGEGRPLHSCGAGHAWTGQAARSTNSGRLLQCCWLQREQRGSGTLGGLSEYEQQTYELWWNNLEFGKVRICQKCDSRNWVSPDSDWKQCCMTQVLSWSQSSLARFPCWIFTENKPDYQLQVTCQTYLVNIIIALKSTLRVWVRHKPKHMVKCVGWSLFPYRIHGSMNVWWVYQVAHAHSRGGWAEPQQHWRRLEALNSWFYTHLLISKYDIKKPATLRNLKIYFDCSSVVFSCLLIN